ncbi:unnamed protein product [Periconia digitata]|uniref:Mak10-domain-containing protein n=1 Tax=Periconia digitata TaxID=1303443 RepID=A0A9W4U8I7_9PLEO|nr:unnamed protein product [Periconia digitata]
MWLTNVPASTTDHQRPPTHSTSAPAMEPKIIDITEKFTAACNGLDVGQLVKDAVFTLYESIGAVEIMDPKMDSGFLQPGESLEDDYDPLTRISPEELIGIMDQLLCYEMAWHTGYPLSQTLFTSIHIDRLLWPEAKVLEQAQFYRGEVEESRRPDLLLEALRAYCLAVVKSCDYVIAKITSRDYFEEEDFCSQTYNRVLFVQIPTDVFARELDAVIEAVEESTEIDKTLQSAIILRLNVRKTLLLALDIDLPLPYLAMYWLPILNSLTTIEETHLLGKPVPSAFSTKIQRRLASTVPPRPIAEVAFKDAMKTFRQLCTDCQEATRFIQIPKDPIEYQSFLWTFATRNPPPLPYSRSYLGTIAFSPEILQSNVPLTLIDIESFVFKSESKVLDPSHRALSPPLNPRLPYPLGLQLVNVIDTFLDRVNPAYTELWITLCQNRCRIRRMLIHVIAAWDILQKEAETADAELATICQAMGIAHELMDKPLTTWVYIRKLWMLEKVILLGFDQTIYRLDEMSFMYYFLYMVAEQRARLLAQCKQHVIGTPPPSPQRSQSPALSLPLRPTPSQPSSQSPTQPVSEEDSTLSVINFPPTSVPPPNFTASIIDSTSHIELDDSENAAFLRNSHRIATGTLALAAALSRLYTILLYLRGPNKISPLSTSYLRYEARMKPFHALSSPPTSSPSVFENSQNLAGGVSLLQKAQGLGNDVWTEMQDATMVAMQRLNDATEEAAKGSKAEGVKDAWDAEMKGLTETCMIFDEIAAEMRGRLYGEESGEGVKGIKVLIEKEDGKDYDCLGWITPGLKWEM